MKTVLTIAGSDPSGGAGIQSDIRTFDLIGVKGLSVITAITAQTDNSVTDVFPVSAYFVKKQISTLISSYTIDSIKVGMLATGNIIRTLISTFNEYKFRRIVLDPVIRSSSGFPLLDKDGIKALRDILPHSLIVTPNISEASILTGLSVTSTAEMENAAIRIRNMGARYVLVKGGHLDGKAIDVLYDGNAFRHFSKERVPGDFHGTGCTLSSAVTAYLVSNTPVEEAVSKAKEFITIRIKEGKLVRRKTAYQAYV